MTNADSRPPTGQTMAICERCGAERRFLRRAYPSARVAKVYADCECCGWPSSMRVTSPPIVGNDGRPPARPCEHWNFAVNANVARLTRSEEDATVVGFTCDLTARCADCDEPFEWIGLPMGALLSEPACSIDGTEARMPLRPVSASRDFGRNLPGFSVKESRP